ncbi:unnamed protein product [Phytophthora lilii]|uniref:Unnamed protein product n=1 Tax=Phytophthora lilii TaxID=2077276 RepID=A0A9W6WSB2_9STRA|nr:unnamed protein product [Phytophthora lilii]
MSEKRIIELSTRRTTDDQLMKLANSLGVKVDQIDFKQHLDRSKDYCILNMGTPQIGGTHWMAVSNKDKMYFDPRSAKAARNSIKLQIPRSQYPESTIWSLWAV